MSHEFPFRARHISFRFLRENKEQVLTLSERRQESKRKYLFLKKRRNVKKRSLRLDDKNRASVGPGLNQD